MLLCIYACGADGERQKDWCLSTARGSPSLSKGWAAVKDKLGEKKRPLRPRYFNPKIHLI